MGKHMVIRMGLLVLALGLVYGGADLAGADVPGGVAGMVTVENTASNPVPVAQQGTATVSVGNAATAPVPVQQQGTATVSVSNASLPVTGTVKIDPSGNTVQTSASDNPAFSPVEVTTDFNIADGQINNTATAYTVPAGKELVIQDVTFVGTLPAGEHLLTVSVKTSSASNFYPPLAQETDVQGGTVSTGGAPTTMYVGPGDQVVLFASRDSQSGLGFVDVTLNGYLATLP